MTFRDHGYEDLVVSISPDIPPDNAAQIIGEKIEYKVLRILKKGIRSADPASISLVLSPFLSLTIVIS